jgi:hypothetical protein
VLKVGVAPSNEASQKHGPISTQLRHVSPRPIY